MSAPKYRYGHGTSKRRPKKALVVGIFSFLTLAIIVGIVFLDIRKSESPVVEGESRVVNQVLGDTGENIVINEPTFTLQLPADWKEISRNKLSTYNSIDYQATAKGKDNRYLTVYVDRLPTEMPINRIVTVRTAGNTLKYDDVSDNCANFTIGGTQEGRIVTGARATLTKWNKVDFLCNLPQSIDNQIGIGTEGSINSVAVTGPTQGVHKYFIVYIDRNFQPDYSILYDVLTSFRAK